ncbi:MAG: hypothetical protein AAF639_18995, partial [Chloroflexota bacterium]
IYTNPQRTQVKDLSTILADKDEHDWQTLNELLTGPLDNRLQEIGHETDQLKQTMASQDYFISNLQPILPKLLQESIKHSKAEIIEILHPIIGQLIARMMIEAVRNLAERIDEHMRRVLNVRAVFSQFWSSVRPAQTTPGAVFSSAVPLSDSQESPESLLAFHISEIFLIHYDTGLLLRHVSNDADISATLTGDLAGDLTGDLADEAQQEAVEAVDDSGDDSGDDSDVISGMLTAIRDFVHDAFGEGESLDNNLNEIQYGMKRILLETGQYAYLAVVLDGLEPATYRHHMLETLSQIEEAYADVLRTYNGDYALLASAQWNLDELLDMAMSPH